MRDFYMAQIRAREIDENTGITLVQQAEMPLDEWSRLAYGRTPAAAALAALQAQPGPTNQPQTCHSAPITPNASPGRTAPLICNG
jgi:hypothetical protein